jgi:hypothetical protein
MFDSRNKDARKLKEFDKSATGIGDVQLPCFDKLLELAREKPSELEVIRQKLCNQLIESAPEHMRDRLNGLQFQIDMERQLANNPVSSCLKISALMNDSLQELKELLGNPEEYLRNRTQKTAEILQFQLRNQEA